LISKAKIYKTNVKSFFYARDYLSRLNNHIQIRFNIIIYDETVLTRAGLGFMIFYFGFSFSAYIALYKHRNNPDLLYGTFFRRLRKYYTRAYYEYLNGWWYMFLNVNKCAAASLGNIYFVFKMHTYRLLIENLRSYSSLCV